MRLLGRLVLGGITSLLSATAGAQNATTVTYEDVEPVNVALTVAGFGFASGLKKGTDGNPNCNGLELVPSGWAGSGFTVQPDGTLMTNFHVARRALQVRAQFDGGARYEVRYIKAYDSQNDLATLQIVGNPPFRHAVLGDSSTVRPLDSVIAVGNTKATGMNITEGKVSRVNRNSVGQPETIQHTAPIAEGNSGGALYRGKEVIGINTAVISGTGFGIAVPSNVARGLLKPERSKPTLLTDAFPTDPKAIVTRIREKDTATAKGTVPPSSKYRLVVNLDHLRDYLMVVKPDDDVDLDLVVLDGEERRIGCGTSSDPRGEALFLSAEYPREVAVDVYNGTDRAVSFVFAVAKINW